MTLREQLLTLFEGYCASRTLSPSRVSTLVFNGGHVIERITSGGDVTTGRFEHAVQWFSANWPDGTPWPDDIPRPEPKLEEAAPDAR
jgi:hypothetical protein